MSRREHRFTPLWTLALLEQPILLLVELALSFSPSSKCSQSNQDSVLFMTIISHLCDAIEGHSDIIKLLCNSLRLDSNLVSFASLLFLGGRNPLMLRYSIFLL